MSRRIEIELTSARPDGSWTWRAAGAQKPKGVLDGALLPSDATVGLIVKADAEYELDGITILAVMGSKAKAEKGNVLELLPSDKPFEAVIETRARRERGERSDRSDRGERGDRRDRGPRREGDNRPERGDRRPRFDAPPELPQRPKAKRLKPGRAHRNAALAGLDPAQRTIAERVLQGGIPAVRQAVTEQNVRLKAEGAEPIEPHGLLQLAEQLQPALRVAEWLDRADAAVADLAELDLRDLRSVVASAEDPMVARDESTRQLAATLKEALASKQDKEQGLWLDDIDAAIGVGRVVRALKLSSQPPKAGVPFPAELAGRLAAAAVGNLTADALPDRWIAVLEAVAFSPVRSQVVPAAKPAQVSDDLLATVKRLGSRVPAIAALFGVEVDAKAQPKPLRPTRPATGKPAPKSVPKPPAAKADAPVAEAAAPAAETAEVAEVDVVADVVADVAPDSVEGTEA